MKVSGYFLCVSSNTPESRLFHFHRPSLSFEVKVLFLEKVYLTLPLFENKRQSLSQGLNELKKISSKSHIHTDVKDSTKDYNFIYILTKNHDWRQKSMNFQLVYDSIKKEELLEEIDEANFLS